MLLILRVLVVLCLGGCSFIAWSDSVTVSMPKGLTEHQRFTAYPYIARAQESLARGDSKRAIIYYQHVVERVPDNGDLVQLLAQAWHHSGDDKQARAILRQYLDKYPHNQAILLALARLPLQLPDVHTREQLLSWQQGCDTALDPRCLVSVARKGMEIGALDISWQLLSSAELQNSLQGRDMMAELATIATSRGEWQLADNCYSVMDHRATLTPQQYENWFLVLQQMHNDRRIVDLQAQGVMNTPQMQLALANTLESRGEKQKLQEYLESHYPLFTDSKDEHRWVEMIYGYSARPVKTVARYRAVIKSHRAAASRRHAVPSSPPVHRQLAH